jgi:hypothetical protein
MRAIAAISLALVIGIWSLATLLIDAIVTPVRGLAERIETGPPRASAFFAAIRRMDTEAGALAVCPRDLVRSAVSIELAALDAASRDGKKREWEMGLAAADRLLRHGLRCFPYDGNLWLRLAMVEFARTGPTRNVADMLKMSANVAPNEAWIISPRIVFATKLLDFQSETVRKVLEADVRTFAQHAHVGEVGALYVRVGEQGRPVFDQTIALVDGERRAALEDAIASNLKALPPERRP